MMNLYIFTGCALLLSLFLSRTKTAKALKIAMKKLLRIVPPFLVMIIGISLGLFLLPEGVISRNLGGTDLLFGVFLASLLGSAAFIPGFIAFPLCGILRDQGVTFTVLSAFSTTLMMVGVATFPLEQKYLGTKMAIARNIAGFAIALAVALATGLVFREIP